MVGEVHEDEVEALEVTDNKNRMLRKAKKGEKM